MKRKRDRNESNATRSRINRWVRWLQEDRDWDYENCARKPIPSGMGVCQQTEILL